VRAHEAGERPEIDIATMIVRAGRIRPYTAAVLCGPGSELVAPARAPEIEPDERPAARAQEQREVHGERPISQPSDRATSWSCGSHVLGANSRVSGDCCPGLIRTLTRRWVHQCRAMKLNMIVVMTTWLPRRA